MRDLIALLVRIEQWDHAGWLARAMRVLEDPSAAPDAVADATWSLHNAVLAADGPDDAFAGDEASADAARAPVDATSLGGQLRDLAAQLFVLTE